MTALIVGVNTRTQKFCCYNVSFYKTTNQSASLGTSVITIPLFITSYIAY